MTHTPGPWHFYMEQDSRREYGNTMTYRIQSDGDRVLIENGDDYGNAVEGIENDRAICILTRADISPNGHIPYNGDEEESNARLIAAAPELLAALKLLMEQSACRVSHNQNPFMATAADKAMDAINKAQGE